MSANRTFEVGSAAEAAEALEYFNAFHDGFIRRMVVTSQDTMDAEGGQTCTGCFDVDLEIAHYNYPPGGLRPFDQVVHARFEDVQDPFLDLGQGYMGNTITRLLVTGASRRRGGTTTVEPCLALRLGRQFYLEDSRRWEYREAEVFTFRRATLREAPPAPPAGPPASSG